MTNGMLVDYTRIEEIAQTLDKSSANMKSILDRSTELMNTVNTSDTIKSDGAEELYLKYKSLSTKFEAFYNAISEYARFLHEVVRVYNEADKNIGKQANDLLQS